MLEAKKISFSYDDTTVLNNVSLTFEDGKIYGLIGKNGIGKTTLLKILSRYINKNSGDIQINHHSIADIDYLDTDITLVFDECNFFNELTFIEHLNLIAKSSNRTEKEYKEFIQKFISSLDLEKYKNSYPGTLSKGTLQRLNIGMGLIRNTSYLLMDEPFNGLDPVQTIKSLNFIKEYNRGIKHTIIISSHQLDYLKYICDEYIIMTSKGIIKLRKSQINEDEIIRILSDDTVS